MRNAFKEAKAAGFSTKQPIVAPIDSLFSDRKFVIGTIGLGTGDCWRRLDGWLLCQSPQFLGTARRALATVGVRTTPGVSPWLLQRK